MSFENFQLQPNNVSELYNNSEFILEESQANARSIDVHPPKFLGNFGQQILILILNDTQQFLPDSELDLLTAILSACKLNLGDVALVNLRNLNPIDAASLITDMQAKKVMTFGCHEKLNALQHAAINGMEQIGGAPVLIAPALQTLQADAHAKKSLWASLKLFFQL